MSSPVIRVGVITGVLALAGHCLPALAHFADMGAAMAQLEALKRSSGYSGGKLMKLAYGPLDLIE